MQTAKVSCSQCPHQEKCPQKTRLFVNYCGGDQKRMGGFIRGAQEECRLRRGHLFGRAFALRGRSFIALPALARS